MIPIVAIRPEPGCSTTVACGRELGLTVQGFPLFAIEPIAWSSPGPASVDALLIGSANAVRHAGPAIARFAGTPAYAVGAVTAQACHDVGLQVAAIGSGGLQSLLARLAPEHRRLLRLAGRERVELASPTGFTITERIVYQARALPLPNALIELLARPAIVLLHSAEAARHFACECDRAEVDRAQITIATIGPRVSDAAGSGWAKLAAAPIPSDQALLELARYLCQERG